MSLKYLMVVLCFLFVSCVNDPEDTQPVSSWGIYLTPNNVTAQTFSKQSLSPSVLTLLLSSDDISGYTWSTHTIHLTAQGKQKLDTVSIPVQGRSFSVCVNNSSVYTGSFWIPISSIPFSGTTIIVTRPIPDSIRITRGYPVDSDTSMPDPRNNADLKNALIQSGKLR